jgi:hypothetical protein
VSLVGIVLALLSAQLLVLSRALLGNWAPDLLVVVLLHGALFAPARRLLLVPLVVGWLRALVLLEPVGGQVLGALVATLLVSSLRSQLRDAPALGWVFGAFLAAGSWSLTVALLELVSGVPLVAGRELVLGAVLAVPLAGVAAARARRPSHA